MAFLYDHTVEELTTSTGKKVAIGVLLTLIFHLGDALLGGHLAKNYKINASEIGKVNHLPPHSPMANANPLPYYRSSAAGLNPLPYYAGRFKPSTLT